MKDTFIALVGVHMLAELLDDERLRQALEGMPDLPQWHKVRRILEKETHRRGIPFSAPRKGTTGRARSVA